MRMKLVLYLALLVPVLATLTGRDVYAKNSDEYRIFRAAEAASHDFLKRLEQERKYDWEYSEFVSSFKNYNVGISEGKDFYYVVFQLKKIDATIFGGGGEYIVRKSDLKIINFKGYE